jgi:competence ComEA-like helix-hairpin-helix protein
MRKILLFSFVCLFASNLILASEKIDINNASLEELEKLTGVGPVIAKRIIEARPFSSVDDLIRVKGIGQKKLEAIKKQGLAFVQPTFKIEGQEKNLKKENQKDNILEKEAASLARFEEKGNKYNQESFKIFLIALLFSLSAGFLILFLKIKIKKKGAPQGTPFQIS